MQKSKYILTIIAMIIVSCSSASNQQDCVKDSESNLLMTWGVKYNTTGWRVYRTINTQRQVYKIEEDSLGNKRYSDTIRISQENYCKIKQDLTQFVINTQALYVPAKIQHFVQYRDDNRNIFFQAIWNPEHDNTGNKELKVFYDSLEYRMK